MFQKPISLDLADTYINHKEDGVLGGVDAAVVSPNQDQPYHSPTPSSSFNKEFLEDEEDFHQVLARDLGLSFAEHKPNIANMMIDMDNRENPSDQQL